MWPQDQWSQQQWDAMVSAGGSAAEPESGSVKHQICAVIELGRQQQQQQQQQQDRATTLPMGMQRAASWLAMQLSAPEPQQEQQQQQQLQREEQVQVPAATASPRATAASSAIPHATRLEDVNLRSFASNSCETSFSSTTQVVGCKGRASVVDSALRRIDYVASVAARPRQAQGFSIPASYKAWCPLDSTGGFNVPDPMQQQHYQAEMAKAAARVTKSASKRTTADEQMSTSNSSAPCSQKQCTCTCSMAPMCAAHTAITEAGCSMIMLLHSFHKADAAALLLCFCPANGGVVAAWPQRQRWRFNVSWAGILQTRSRVCVYPGGW